MKFLEIPARDLRAHPLRSVLTSAGVAVAAFLQEASRWQGKNVIIIICGRNVSAEVLTKLCGK